jgi:hypothetical protein
MSGRRVLAFCLVCLSLAPAARAQSSGHYSLEEHVFNTGGRPADGVVAASGHFTLSIDSVGEGIAGLASSGSNFSMEGGFTAAYVPPVEVEGLRFIAGDTLAWDVESSAGIYNLYRGRVRDLPGLSSGECLEQEITGESTVDPAFPDPSGEGYFYLVTAENRLADEGSMGADSDGSERVNDSPCP